MGDVLENCFGDFCFRGFRSVGSRKNLSRSIGLVLLIIFYRKSARTGSPNPITWPCSKICLTDGEDGWTERMDGEDGRMA